MTPTPETADIAGLVERHKHQINGTGPWRTAGPDETLQEFVAALQSLSAELAEVKRREAEACRYMENLLRSYVGKYCDPVPDWQPLQGDLIGMLTQIDNATTVTAEIKTRADSAEAEAKAMREALEMAKMYVERDEEVHGRKFGTGNAIRAALAREGK